MVNTSTQQVIHYSESSSSASQVSNGSDASGTSENHSHRLAANVPKKRTGRRVFRETRHPVYRGVRSRKGGRWVCEVREPNTGTRVWLGTYTNPEMAARAHDVAALAFRGKSACLNFADSAWRLPVPSSVDANDIRRAAAEAAEMFRPGAATVPDEQECSNSYVEAAEEEVVEVPRFVWEMAEGGILMSPPPSYGAESYGWSYVESCNNNNNAADYDWSLWNY